MTVANLPIEAKPLAAVSRNLIDDMFGAGRAAALQNKLSFRCGAGNGCEQPYALSGVSERIREISMNNVIYLVGLVVIVLAILSFLGIR